MDKFILQSEYAPTGDQPQAIEALVNGFKEGNQFQTLLGVTGSGKTFTMANVIAALNKPTLIISHNFSDRGNIFEIYCVYLRYEGTSVQVPFISPPRTNYLVLSNSIDGRKKKS